MATSGPEPNPSQTKVPEMTHDPDPRKFPVGRTLAVVLAVAACSGCANLSVRELPDGVEAHGIAGAPPLLTRSLSVLPGVQARRRLAREVAWRGRLDCYELAFLTATEQVFAFTLAELEHLAESTANACQLLGPRKARLRLEARLLPPNSGGVFSKWRFGRHAVFYVGSDGLSEDRSTWFKDLVSLLIHESFHLAGRGRDPLADETAAHLFDRCATGHVSAGTLRVSSDSGLATVEGAAASAELHERLSAVGRPCLAQCADELSRVLGLLR